jgi:predicted GNAT family acetyltransferase
MDVEGAIAFADYRPKGNQIALVHVETPPQLRGKGVAAKLMEGIVTDAKKRNLIIQPICPYAIAYMQRHNLFAGQQ